MVNNVTRSKDAILEDLAREETSLAAIDCTRQEAQARIQALRSELEAAL
jgi:hypothetical protein